MTETWFKVCNFKIILTDVNPIIQLTNNAKTNNKYYYWDVNMNDFKHKIRLTYKHAVSRMNCSC